MRVLPVVIALSCACLVACADDSENETPDASNDVSADAGGDIGADVDSSDAESDTTDPGDAGSDTTIDAEADADVDAAIDGSDDVQEDAESDTTEPVEVEDACLGDEDAFRLVQVLPSEPLLASYVCLLDCAESDEPIACASACVAAETGLSDTCSGCFATSVDCASTTCADDCERQGSSCTACLRTSCRVLRERCVGDVESVVSSRAASVNAVNISPDFGDAAFWHPGFLSSLLPTVEFLQLVRGPIPSSSTTAFEIRTSGASVDETPIAVEGDRPTGPDEVVTVAIYGTVANGTLAGHFARESNQAPESGARYRVFHAADSEATASIDVWNEMPAERGWMYDDMTLGTMESPAVREAGVFALGVDVDDDTVMEAIFDIPLVDRSQHTFWILTTEEGLMLLDTTARGAADIILPRDE